MTWLKHTLVPNLRHAIYLKIGVWVSEYENEICYVQVIHYYHILLMNGMIDKFQQFQLSNEKILSKKCPPNTGIGHVY